ncbi:MAG: alanine racemase [Alphaproteobacteria bacterium]|nr:alanine racemase [Alphaproteobacteria bacterium]
MDNHNGSSHLTQAIIHLDRLSHNMRLLQQQVGDRPLWPAIKANAYGHGAEIVARHLVDLGYDTLCVAHVFEATALLEAGIEATFIILSATLPEHAEAIVAHGCEPAICTMDMAEALARAAERDGRCIPVHLKVDTGMGRIGIRSDEAAAFLDRCRQLPGLTVRGIMSHFPRADESDKDYSLEQIERFRQVLNMTRGYGIEVRHMANSAAILNLPGSYFDAARPGIAIYGLRPSAEVRSPLARQLRPALEWKSRITFVKEVPGGTGLSYGHAFHTERDSLIATVPVGYGDGLSRRLSGKMGMLVHGRRCKQVGRITMDQSLLDVTRLRGQVEPGDEVVLIGRQGEQEITADELAGTLGTINYEIVTAIAQRVHRVAIGPGVERAA